MNEQDAFLLAQNILLAVFQKKTNESLEKIQEKYAFDAKLPYEVKDSVTGETTWADSINYEKYITATNSLKKETENGWKRKKETLRSFADILKHWNEINYLTTQRVYDSENVSKSDTIYRCHNVYHSVNCNDSSNIVFCNGVSFCENTLASSRTIRCTNSIRVDDSSNCSNSYNVVCSNKISNSLFIQDCSNMDECMFCAHISNCHFYICNMPFEEEEYYAIKKVIVNWILNS